MKTGQKGKKNNGTQGLPEFFENIGLYNSMAITELNFGKSVRRRDCRYTCIPRELGCEKYVHFLSRVSTLTRDIDIAILSVGLSICPCRSGIR